jgi:hypothetical protein
MHHAQENQHPQRLPGPRIHTRCILSRNTRNTMACDAFVAQSHAVAYCTYTGKHACPIIRPSHTTNSNHSISAIASYHISYFALPPSLSIRKYRLCIFPTAPSCAHAHPLYRSLPRRTNESRFSVCDYSRRCRVDSMLCRGVEAKMPWRFVLRRGLVRRRM